MDPDFDLEGFCERGWTVVDAVFSRELAERALKLVLERLPGGEGQARRKRRSQTLLAESQRHDDIAGILTDRYRAMIGAFCGPGRAAGDWDRNHLGYTVVNYPGIDRGPWSVLHPLHVDGNNFHHRVDSPEQGLVCLDVLTDVAPEGAGTAVREGSHRVVARILADHEPDGLEHVHLRELANLASGHLPIREITARAGDVVVLHPHLLHGSSRHLGPAIRAVGNRCIPLREPLCYRRADRDYSPVEAAVRQVVAASSVV